MEYRSLGRSGVQVSAVGLGTDQFGTRVDQDGVTTIVRAALDQGINFIDTADSYGNRRHSEMFLGEALGGHRQQVVIATKGHSTMGEGPNDRGGSRYHLMHALEESLRRLKTDYVDLYQMHWFDPKTPMDEIMRTLDDMVRSGKVRYVGASNYAAWQMAICNEYATRYGTEPFITIQPHYHMLEREVEREMLHYCRYSGVGILPYFPLAGGLLANPNYRYQEPPPEGTRADKPDWQDTYTMRYATRENFQRIEKFKAFVAERGRELVELPIAWLLAEPLVSSVIAGVSKAEHVAPNAAAAGWKLTEDEQAEIREILESPVGK
jgi:aryl-alcohol dehydrogenase-like predicted oxidoreductase